MIYEIRTYDLKVGKVPEVEKNVVTALQHREKYSKITGWFHTEIGPLNQVVHIWGYEDAGQRGKVRAQAVQDPNWPPKDDHLIEHMASEILVPAPFMRPLKPGHYGNIYEMRMYTCKPGSIPEIYKRWEPLMEGRQKYSPCILVGHTDVGGSLNKLIHVWPYESLEERARIRKEVVEKGVWPPKSAEFILKMENKILVPADFSPLN